MKIKKLSSKVYFKIKFKLKIKIKLKLKIKILKYLFIGGQGNKKWYEVTFEVLQLDFLRKFSELRRSGTTNHGSVILTERTEICA